MSNSLRGVAIRLHGPLQAWGGASVGDDRPTLPFPTRSGVLGLVACCLGIGRRDTTRLQDLAGGTRVHVRVDLPGTPLVDDQTIQGNPNASPTRQTIQSKRTYLSDASFVAVVVPGPRITPAEIANALLTPVFVPYLGRRACAPSTPLLAAAEVAGPGPLDLFASIERGPAEVVEQLDRRGWDIKRDGGEPTCDFYLDVDEHAGSLRRVPVRDDFTGPLPRQWRERFALHVRAPLTSQAS